ncbi:DUF5076 domain-containing protein [Stenotrophomonas sp.]|uniref:DUF5076 domain-containing protein n=1 Tax=Stenotrophomonas sp. TaxID=69392 RepID=UPI002FCAF743
MNEQPIPPAALADDRAVEMLRVWVASRGLHCSMKVGLQAQVLGIAEERAWGMILADTARQLAEAMAGLRGSADAGEPLEAIIGHFLAEVGQPASPASAAGTDAPG